MAQSGWQERHAPPDEKVLGGQEVVQVPLMASWLELQVRQNLAFPTQVEHEESHASRQV